MPVYEQHENVDVPNAFTATILMRTYFFACVVNCAHLGKCIWETCIYEARSFLMRVKYTMPLQRE